MSVVARLVVQETATFRWPGTKVKLAAEVPQRDDPHYEEIQAFFEATPQASFEAVINNEIAAEQFQPGQAFYVTFEPCPT